MSLVRALGLERPALSLVLLVVSGCGPSTVDPGPDFSVADVVFDESYFYCSVEPLLFAYSCGSGDTGSGDAAGGCHYNVTSYRLTNYSPLVAESCQNPSTSAPGTVTQAARQNYQASQARMKRDPEIAPLLQKPLKNQAHPRQIFDEGSDAALAIRAWAEKFSSQ